MSFADDSWLEGAPAPKTKMNSGARYIVTKDKLGTIIGKSPKDLDKMVRAGCPVIRDGATRAALRFNVPDVVAWMIAQAEPDEDSLDEAKRRERIAIARERELKTQMLIGEAVNFADVIKEIRSDMATLRTGLLALSSRVDAPPEVKVGIDREIVELINGMSVQRKFGGGHGPDQKSAK